MPKLSIIAAMDEQGLIGAGDKLPWHLSRDLKHFKAMTLGKPIVMGRRTFESIGKKPLPGRQNIVLTSDQNYLAPDCDVVASVGKALEVAGNVEEVMIIGGAKLYESTLPRVDTLYLTRIAHNFTGDTYFPKINFEEWEVVARVDHPKDENNAYDLSFMTYERKSAL